MTWFFHPAQWNKGKEMSYPAIQNLLLKLDMSFQLFGESVPAAASTTMLATTSEEKTTRTLWSVTCNPDNALVIVMYQWMRLKFGKSYCYWSVKALKRKHKQTAQKISCAYSPEKKALSVDHQWLILSRTQLNRAISYCSLCCTVSIKN